RCNQQQVIGILEKLDTFFLRHKSELANGRSTGQLWLAVGSNSSYKACLNLRPNIRRQRIYGFEISFRGINTRTVESSEIANDNLRITFRSYGTTILEQCGFVAIRCANKFCWIFIRVSFA